MRLSAARPSRPRTARPPPSPSPRRSSIAVIRRPADRSPDAHARVDPLGREDPSLRAVLPMADEFAAMVRNRTAVDWEDWLQRAESVASRRGFADGIRRDEAAVRAGLSQPWSNGPAEGPVGGRSSRSDKCTAVPGSTFSKRGCGTPRERRIRTGLAGRGGGAREVHHQCGRATLTPPLAHRSRLRGARKIDASKGTSARILATIPDVPRSIPRLDRFHGSRSRCRRLIADRGSIRRLLATASFSLLRSDRRPVTFDANDHTGGCRSVQPGPRLSFTA